MKNAFKVMLGDNLRRLREENSLTQFDLAAKSGVSLTSIIGFEREKQKNPSVETLGKIAAALNVPITDFFEDSSPVEACHE